MDADRFDALARAFTGSVSRRTTLLGLLAGLVPSLVPRPEAVAKRRKPHGTGKTRRHEAPRAGSDRVGIEKKKRKKKKKPAPCPPACPGNKNCGSDGCGGACGSCAAPQTCGGGGTPGVCGCTTLNACPLGQDCGTVPDGCGGTIACGACTAPQTCGGSGTPGVCGGGLCTNPSSCASDADCCGSDLCSCGEPHVCVQAGSLGTGACCKSNDECLQECVVQPSHGVCCNPEFPESCVCQNCPGCPPERPEVCAGTCVAPCPDDSARNPESCGCCLTEDQAGTPETCCSGQVVGGDCRGRDPGAACTFDAQCLTNSCGPGGCGAP